jgi:site-specific recombinase
MLKNIVIAILACVISVFVANLYFNVPFLNLVENAAKPEAVSVAPVERWFILVNGQIVYGEPVGSLAECEKMRQSFAANIEQKVHNMRSRPPFQNVTPQEAVFIFALADKMDADLYMARSMYCDKR